MRKGRLVLAIRVLFGLFMVFSGVSGFLSSSQDMQGIPEAMVSSMKVLKESGIFQMAKVTEIVAGLMLVTGFLPALALLFIAPLAVGIVVFVANIAPANLVIGVVVCALTAFLGYAYWDKYKAIFTK